MVLNVLFIQEMTEELKQYFQEKLKDTNVELHFISKSQEADLVQLVPDVDVLIGWRPTVPILQAAVKARAFINPGVGVKRHIKPFREINATRDTPFLLINGHGNAFFTAEHAVALLLAVYNKIVPYHISMVSGTWRDNNAGPSFTLRGKRVGLLGYGAINQFVHQFLSGFQCRFSALKRSWNRDIEGLKQYSPNQLHEFLEEVDILMLALPHTDETEGMIGAEELALLSSDAVVVNVARGIIIQENALYNALKSKTIAGAGIDVWYNYEPNEDENGAKYPADYKFHELNNVVLSPHRAASPFENLERWDEQIENIKRMAEERTDLLNIVDLERQY